MHTVKEVTLGTETLKIVQDSNVESPRSWDNLSQMIFTGGYKHLGDNHDIEFPQYDSRIDFQVLGADLLKRKLNVAFIKPVHMYKHSGTSISTDDGYPYNCRWDSGTIGFVVVTKEAIRENWSIKRVTQKWIDRAEEIAEAEINTLNQWVSGEVYGFRIEDEDGDVIDSCYGFYGSDLSKNGLADYIDKKYYEALEIKVG